MSATVNRMDLAPLDDPAYEPIHKPLRGEPPEVVAKWGPRSQLRWFDRFRGALNPQREEVWDRFYCSSTLHRGNCCRSCVDDDWEGYGDWRPDRCCCRVPLAGT